MCHDVKSTPWRKKVRYDVKNPSWRQKVRHDVKNMLNVRHDVKNIVITSKSMLWHIIRMLWSLSCQSYLKCQIPFLFTFALTIFLHQFDISTMCRSRVINEYVFFIISVTLTLIDLFQWYIIPNYLYVKFCTNQLTCNEITVWHRAAGIQVHRQTCKQTNTSIAITSLCEINDGHPS